MRIARLSIKNFRSIAAMDEAIFQICALVGPNNAGKTNILEAVRRVLSGPYLRVYDFDQRDIYRHEDSREIEILCSFDPPISYKRFKFSDPADIFGFRFLYSKYKTGKQKGEPRLEQTCLNFHHEQVLVPKYAPKKGVRTPYEPLIGIPAEIKEQVPLVHIGTNRSLKEQLPGARWSMLRRLFEDVNRKLHEPEQTVAVTQADGSEVRVSRVERFREILGEAMDLLRTDDFVALEKAIKRHVLRHLGLDSDADTDALDLYFAPLDTMEFYKSLDLILGEDGFRVSATEVGEGMQNAIVLAILRAFEETRRKGAIFLIEEPEMFLHPQMQRSLYKTMREIGKTNQVVYTTHSPHFVSIPDYEEVLLVRRGEMGTYVTKSSLPTNERRKEKLIKELDPERNELFFAERLLLVEGDTEKLALPEYGKKLGIDLDREGSTIVEVGGKRNLIEFALIASSLNIPTGIIYDKDSSDFKGQRTTEAEYNKKLDSLSRENGLVKVWCLTNNYEDHVRRSVGEAAYQRLCGQFPQLLGNPTRQRLIAKHRLTAVPEPFADVLKWLAGTRKQTAPVSNAENVLEANIKSLPAT